MIRRLLPRWVVEAAVPPGGSGATNRSVRVLAGTVAAEPVVRRLPSGDQVTELRISVPESGRRLLPLPVAVWHATTGPAELERIGKGDPVLVHGQLVRRFYRSGSGARSITEVVAQGSGSWSAATPGSPPSIRVPTEGSPRPPAGGAPCRFAASARRRWTSAACGGRSPRRRGSVRVWWGATGTRSWPRRHAPRAPLLARRG